MKTFNNKLRWILLIYFSVYYFKLTFIKLDIRKFFKDSDLINILDKTIEIRDECKKLEIYHPSDYMSPNNLGIKNGHLVCFDIRDKNDDMFYSILK